MYIVFQHLYNINIFFEMKKSKENNANLLFFISYKKLDNSIIYFILKSLQLKCIAK